MKWIKINLDKTDSKNKKLLYMPTFYFYNEKKLIFFVRCNIQDISI